MSERPEFPTSWAWATFDEVAEIQLGRQRSPKNHAGPHMRPYLRAANVTWDGLDLTDVKEMNFDPDEARTFELREGDILLNEASGSPNEVGKPAIWRDEIPGCCFQNTLLRLRSEHLNLRYLYWYCYYMAFSGQFGEAGRGVNIRHLGKRGLSVLTVAVPPRREQERIVDAIETHLGSIAHASRQLDHARTLVDSLRRSTIGETFNEADWEWTTLGEIAEVRGGVTKDSKRQDDPDFVEVPYLRVANVQRGYLHLDDIATIRVHPEKASALALEENDILFNEGGDRDKLGRGWIWEGQIPGCIHQNHVFRARLLDGGFDPRFVSTHGNTWGQAWFEKHGKQTTNLASINMTTLKQFPVPAPPIEEQRLLMDRLDELTTQLESLEAEVETATRRGESLRRAVLSAAFSGQLAPQDSSDEPASELLERIKAERTALKRRPKKKVSS